MSAGVARWLRGVIRDAFPKLDFYMEYGAAAEALIKATVNREDIQVVIYRGQLRIGSASEPHDDLEYRVGTQGLEPWADDLHRAAQYASRTR